MLAAKPTPTPYPVEAQDVDNFLALFRVFVQAVNTISVIWVLGAVLLVALSLTYVVMHVVKNVLRVQLPGHYKRLLHVVLAILVGVAAGAGYAFAGLNVALAAGIGAAASSIAHDVVDGLRRRDKTE